MHIKNIHPKSQFLFGPGNHRFIEGLDLGELGVEAVDEPLSLKTTENNMKLIQCKLGLQNCRVVPDIRPFLISGIRPDIRFHLPYIRLAG